jgi:hypothetical protein
LDLIEIPRYVRYHTNRVERVTAVAILKVINLSATLLGCASLEGSTQQARHIAYPKGDKSSQTMRGVYSKLSQVAARGISLLNK